MMSSRKKKVVWLSANTFGFEVLQRAAAGIPEVVISAVITLTDDSKTKMYDSIDRKEWDIFGVSVRRIKTSDELEPILRKLKPDFLVMCGWRQLLPESVLSIPPGGVIGFHPTLLPKGRGPAPIINSILSGVRESGVTMFYVSPGLDDGDIIGQEPFTIEEHDTAGAVYYRATEGAKVLVRKYLPLLAHGTAPRVPQDAKEATYFPKRTLKDNELLPTDSKEMMLRKVRALSKPYLGAYIKIGGKKIVVWQGDVIDD